MKNGLRGRHTQHNKPKEEEKKETVKTNSGTKTMNKSVVKTTKNNTCKNDNN